MENSDISCCSCSANLVVKSANLVGILRRIAVTADDLLAGLNSDQPLVFVVVPRNFHTICAHVHFLGTGIYTEARLRAHGPFDLCVTKGDASGSSEPGPVILTLIYPQKTDGQNLDSAQIRA